MHYNLILNILEFTDEAIIMIDTEGKITLLNKKAEKIIGIERDDALGKIITEIIPHSTLLEVIKTGEIIEDLKMEINQSICIVNRFPVFKDRVLQGAVSIFRDITELEKKNKVLKEYRYYKENMEVILSVFNEMIVITDNDGYVTYMTDAYQEFVGLDFDPVGKHVTEVIPNTRMHIVAQTGVKELGDIQDIHGKKMVPQRIPLILNGEQKGVIGKVMYKDVGDLYLMHAKIERLEKELSTYKQAINSENSAKYFFDNNIGQNKNFVKELMAAKKVALTDVSVLITGESGTGKELVAHSVHNASKRAKGPFIKVNCAAIPSELLETELFGYEEGAFTSAKKGGKPGKFILANNGTILLDEIGDMPLGMQAKLLRILQEKEVEKVGGQTSIPVDVRVIASTNKNLEELVKRGEFREDLFYRLNVVNIRMPALRERKDDIRLLANHLRVTLGKRLGIYVEGIEEEVYEKLEAYDWPGNIRELSNVLERTMIFMDDDNMIRLKHLPDKYKAMEAKKHDVWEHGQFDLKYSVAKVEKDIIQKAMDFTGGNKLKTAEILGISRANLYKKLDEYSIQ